MTMSPRFGRRFLLRGLGGAVVAAPFLHSVVEKAAKGQGAGLPRRLIVMFTHYGCLTDRWFPVNSHGPLSAEDFTGTSLESLAPHARKILMPRGIRAMNEWTTDASLGQGNDPNTQVVGSYFTCVPITPHTSDPFSFDQATRFNAKPTAPSLDHVCALQVQASGVPLFMRVSGASENTQSAISYSGPEEAYPGIGSPEQAFSEITGLLTPGEPVSPDSFALLRGKSTIDLVRGDLETLERFDMSRADRLKLEAWKELLTETSTAVVSGQCSEPLAASLGLSQANFDAFEAPATATDKASGDLGGGLDGAELFSNIAVLAALCDRSRVTVLKYPGNYVFRGLGMTMESHSLSNRVGNAGMSGPCVDDVFELIQTIDRYYAAKFTHLVSQLDSITEDDGTLLDNTAAVWFQESSDGAAYNLNNLPIIQAGSCGGYFRTGEAVNVEDGSSDLTRGNSTASCPNGARSSDLKASGTPADIANAPINKYYCNLMNALGVKAGTDGFPLVGGTEPVTHYGMYDDTRDFASGGENPPLINDPGEFEALRASS